MNLQIAKWGNSLALRIPSEVLRRLGLREGVTVEAQFTVDLRLLAVAPVNFHRAAELVLDGASALRAGAALHLACSEVAGSKKLATLDDVLSRNARHLKIKSVVWRSTA